MGWLGSDQTAIPTMNEILSNDLFFQEKVVPKDLSPIVT